MMAQQKSSTASAAIIATIVTPIGITKTVDLNFGNIAAGNTSGTVKLDPAGSLAVSGGVIIPSENGTATPASFLVTGEGNYTFTITLPPESYTVTRISGPETMLVNNFTSIPSITGRLISGTQTIFVGATLTVGASQPASEYKSESAFEITVNYN
jgi:hypothetical protein